MREGTQHKPLWECQSRSELRERFRKVILGAGYGEPYAECVLTDYFDEYMKDVPKFVKMLESYEQSRHSRD